MSSANDMGYWNSISPTVHGMLGGLPQISRIDLRGSANFLTKLRRQHATDSSLEMFARGADCGAGIGRVTAGFLSKFCDTIDVIEPIQKFAEAIKEAEMTGTGKLGRIYIEGLESWIPDGQYDLIWNQWCLGYLTDRQLVTHFERCKTAVAEGGWIVVKENMSTDPHGKDIFDEVDNGVTRTDSGYRKLFEAAGLTIVISEIQKGFPKGLFPVRFYALRPGL